MKPASDHRRPPSVRVTGGGGCGDAIEKASKIIRAGGVVCFPTSGLYGLAADALNPEAVRRVYRIKNRPPEKPLLILVDGPQAVSRWVRGVPGTARCIMDAFWPGGVTVIFDAAGCLPPVLTGGTGKIGVRVPRHPVARMLTKAAGRPITGTSANLSGRPGVADLGDLDDAVLLRTDLVLDAGTLGGGAGSTVVDATVDPPAVLREGAVGRDRLVDVIASAGVCPRAGSGKGR